MAELKKYRALANTFVEGRLVRKGATFLSDAKQSASWELLEGSKEPADEGGEGKKSVTELKAEIAESTDLTFLSALKDDSRKTVSAAAEKRIAELAGPGPDQGEGDE